MQDHIEETTSGIYRVTPEGQVYSQSKMKIPLVGKGMEFTGSFKNILKSERKLTYTLNNRGYYSVVIRKTTHMVHRLVALAFIENVDNKPFVNHIDGNKLNNNFENLEWCTTAENNRHARETGLHIQIRGHKLNYKSAETKSIALNNLKDKSKLTADEVRYVRKTHVARSKDFSATALALKFGTSVAAMCQIIKCKTYSHIK
jgi:hypothetical protein